MSILRKRVPGAFDRPGLSLLELVVVLAILGPLGAMIGMTLVRQQRFYRGATDILYSREAVRDALEVMSADIRGMSNADTAILLTDSAIQFSATIGSSVACQVGIGNEIELPPVSSRGNTLTAMQTSPDSGDLALLYLNAENEWETHRINRFTTRALANGCGLFRSYGTGQEGALTDGFVLSLATPPSPRVKPGAPIRFVRVGRYSLYRSSDREWYLGYRRCTGEAAPGCGPIQPLAGPYRGYSSNADETGLLFSYFDARGAELGAGSSARELARVDVTARAERRGRIPAQRGAMAFGDTGSVTVALRNKLR